MRARKHTFVRVGARTRMRACASARVRVCVDRLMFATGGATGSGSEPYIRQRLVILDAFRIDEAAISISE